MNEVTGSGDVYTMAEAARLKGVSYHTVSRAVRRGKLPATRLGRMALITSEDLRDWRPMRERAPRKYRRREPNPEATPALLDLASAERVELASRLASLSEALYAAAAENAATKSSLVSWRSGWRALSACGASPSGLSTSRADEPFGSERTDRR